MKKLSNDFPTWLTIEAHEEDIHVYDRVESFGELFEDMLFSEDSIMENLVTAKAMDEDGNFAERFLLPKSELIEAFTYADFRYKSNPSINRSTFNAVTQTISIATGAVDDDHVILHEMIHLHEYFLNQLPTYYRDMYFWTLYKDLQEKIPSLDTIIESHANLFNVSVLETEGGVHDILFLLKSLDLDIKKGYRLGTVFAYGYTKLLASYTYCDFDSNR